MIPKQLTTIGLRFCKVRINDKRAFEKGWQDTANYSHDDPSLKEWINKGGNYGVLAGRRGLVILDFDEKQALIAADIYPKTKEYGLSLGDRACIALAIVSPCCLNLSIAANSLPSVVNINCW